MKVIFKKSDTGILKCQKTVNDLVSGVENRVELLRL